jgi:hypothetical protein
LVPFGNALILVATAVSVSRAAAVMMALSVSNCTLNDAPFVVGAVDAGAFVDVDVDAGGFDDVGALLDDAGAALVVERATVVLGAFVVAACVVVVGAAVVEVDGAALVDVVVDAVVVDGRDVTIVAVVVDEARPVEIDADDRSLNVLRTANVSSIGNAATAKYAHRPYSSGSIPSSPLTVHTLRGLIGKDGDRGQPPGDSSRALVGAGPR